MDYKPSSLMLSGEPYILEYIENVFKVMFVPEDLNIDLNIVVPKIYP